MTPELMINIIVSFISCIVSAIITLIVSAHYYKKTEQSSSEQYSLIQRFFDFFKTKKSNSKYDDSILQFKSIAVQIASKLESRRTEAEQQVLNTIYQLKNLKKPESDIDWFLKGCKNIQEKNWEEAVKSFEMSVAIDNEFAEAYNNLGFAYLNLMLKNKAEREEYKKKHLLNIDDEKDLEFQKLQEEQINKSIDNHVKTIQLKSNFAEAYYYLGSFYFANYLYNHDIDSLRLHNISIIDKIQKKLGESESNLGSLLNLLKKVIDINPDFAEAYNVMGICFITDFRAYFVSMRDKRFELVLGNDLKKDDYTEQKANTICNRAIDYFEIAIAKKNNFAEAHFNYGITLLMLAEINKSSYADIINASITHMKLAISFKKDYLNPYISLAKIYYDYAITYQKQNPRKEQEKMWHYYELSISYYNAVVKIKPDDEVIHTEFGKLHYLFGKNSDAIDSYENARRINPQNIIPYLALKKLYLESGDVDRGINILKAAAQKGFTIANLELGVIYLTLNNYIESIKKINLYINSNKELFTLAQINDIVRYCALKISYISVKGAEHACIDAYNYLLEGKSLYFYLGKAYLGNHETKEAIKSFLQEIRYSDRNTEIKREYTYFELGLIYIDKKENDKAIKCFERATGLNNQYTEAFYQLGTIYLKNGNGEKCIENYKKAAKLGNPYTKDWLRRNEI